MISSLNGLVEVLGQHLGAFVDRGSQCLELGSTEGRSNYIAHPFPLLALHHGQRVLEVVVDGEGALGTPYSVIS